MKKNQKVYFTLMGGMLLGFVVFLFLEQTNVRLAANERMKEKLCDAGEHFLEFEDNFDAKKIVLSFPEGTQNFCGAPGTDSEDDDVTCFLISETELKHCSSDETYLSLEDAHFFNRASDENMENVLPNGEENPVCHRTDIYPDGSNIFNAPGTDSEDAVADVIILPPAQSAEVHSVK